MGARVERHADLLRAAGGHAHQHREIGGARHGAERVERRAVERRVFGHPDRTKSSPPRISTSRMSTAGVFMKVPASGVPSITRVRNL